MNPQAIIQAMAKLDRAREALSAMRQFPDCTVIERHWPDFLMAANGVYSKLEQGAKASGTSKAWFGRKKHERKIDPLLSYIHHARNTEEHGLGNLTKRIAKGVHVLNAKKVIFTSYRHAQLHDTPSDGKFIPINPEVCLVRVHDDRYNDSFDPPETHLGNRLPDVTPVGVADAAVVYLQALILEAQAI